MLFFPLVALFSFSTQNLSSRRSRLRPCETFSDGASVGGSHKNDRDLVGHSPTSNSVAEERPNPNPLQRRPLSEMTRSSGYRLPWNWRICDLNPYCDFLAILPSCEVIFIMEIAIALRCRRRRWWRSCQRRQRRSQVNEDRDGCLQSRSRYRVSLSMSPEK